MAVVRPIMEFPQGQGINSSDSQIGGFAVMLVFQGLKDTFGFSE